MNFDVVILGAGAAGLMCALQAGRRGLSVCVIEHNEKIGAKILISGGGRCNFTNTSVGPHNFASRNAEFSRYALSQYPAKSFIQLVKSHQIPFHEKKLGQLFCDRSARDIVTLFQKECSLAKVRFLLSTQFKELVTSEGKSNHRFKLLTSQGEVFAKSLVVATGGLSIPQIGATPLGYEIAKQFKLKIVPRHPALDGFLFNEVETQAFSLLSGLSFDCEITCRDVTFRENLLFTHKGLSGPAALQASLYWYPGEAISVNLLPGVSALEWLIQKKNSGKQNLVKNVLAEKLPARFCEYFCSQHLPPGQTLADMSSKELHNFAMLLNAWKLIPKSTVGYNKAEVTRGGVDTDELSSQSMESQRVPGLYFIGEVVDVTGWLGGYNFQWAWASAWCAAQNLEKA